MKKVVILGATGGCVDILDLIHGINASSGEPQYECAGFLDDKESLWGTKVLGVEVLGGFALTKDFLSSYYFVTGIGASHNFYMKGDILAQLNIPIEKFLTIMHPSAYISSSAVVGLGCIIFQNVVISTNVSIGNNVLVLPNSVVNHGSKIGDNTIISTGVAISGDVQVGEACYIGTKSCIRQNLKIEDESLIGMGSVVLRDVEKHTVVVGNPAKVLRSLNV